VNADAFRVLYDDTAPHLLRFLLRRAQTREDAADLLAETFLIAWTKRDQIPADHSHARPWLFGVARNMLKRERAVGTKASEAVEALARDLQACARNIPPDDGVILALSQLSPVDREIIEMLAWDQLAPREVAAILDLSPNVVRIRAHRARLKLRDQLESSDRARHTDSRRHQAARD
jgi:RNA polymerase sigma-70 factor (ECF subfamily)